MMFVLPSYIVTFCPKVGLSNFSWQVNTEEGLDEFCKVLRLNGISHYSVAPMPPVGLPSLPIGIDTRDSGK